VNINDASRPGIASSSGKKHQQIRSRVLNRTNVELAFIQAVGHQTDQPLKATLCRAEFLDFIVSLADQLHQR